jgi:transposase
MAKQEVTFEEIVERGCGLDVHKKEIVAAVEGTGIPKETRTYKSTTRSLTELKEWLSELGITHIAMESTGVYWKPVIIYLNRAGSPC